MKQITNWRNATVADLEGDGLWETISMIHVVSFKLVGKDIASLPTKYGKDYSRVKAFLEYHIKNKIPLVFHNGICFDVPVLEKFLDMDLSELMLIDTMPLSWYLNVKRKRHGLGWFNEEYGVEKPEIGEDEWLLPSREEGQSQEEYGQGLLEHYKLMKNRCVEDVKINTLLWEDLMQRLIDMYTQSKALIDSGVVGGKRLNDEEEIYLDRYINTRSLDEWIDGILTFLMGKQDKVRIKEATMWEVDVEKIQALHDDLSEKIVIAKATLESVMPRVPKYKNKNFPKKPLKKGKKTKKIVNPPMEFSSSGESWNDVMSNYGKFNDTKHELVKKDIGEPFPVGLDWTEGKGEGVRVKVLDKYVEPNAGSPDQLKSFLFSHGWKPQTYEFVDDTKAIEAWEAGGCRTKKPKPRAVPQISKLGEDGKELCPSVVELAENVPEIMAYQKYTTIKHRRDMVKGWLENLVGGKYLQAGCGGFTNTLREQHRGLVNLPSVDKPYGEDIRGGLIAGKGKTSLGSDLSSLEDRVKHHFMLPHDPDYVATMMADDYDPHLLTAYSAGMINKAEFEGYKKDTLSAAVKKAVSKARKAGKATNYASVYGAGPPTIARSADVSQDQGKQLHKGYWELNWSVNTIADEQVTFKCDKGNMWLVNPVNGFCYSLRSEKDRFSTLCQGTGSFFFDMWVDKIVDSMYDRFKVKRLNGLFHDEYIASFKDTQENRDIMEKITFEAIDSVNDEYLMRRKLGCDVQFGDNYAQIH